MNYTKEQLAEIEARINEENRLTKIDEAIAKEFGLKKMANGRYQGENGDKTALGLARTIERIFRDGKITHAHMAETILSGN